MVNLKFPIESFFLGLQAQPGEEKAVNRAKEEEKKTLKSVYCPVSLP